MIRTFVKYLFKKVQKEYSNWDYLETTITVSLLFFKKNVFDEEVTSLYFVNSICRPMKHNFNHTKVDTVLKTGSGLVPLH